MKRAEHNTDTGKRRVFTTRRAVAVAVILFVLFIIWAELAVGLFGSSFAGS